VTEVNNLQKEADAASEKLALGEISDIHEVGIATETAYLSLLLTVQIRNKILDAYHEVMRMQV
jgi:flagellar hook-basal body complex protein FliE